MKTKQLIVSTHLEGLIVCVCQDTLTPMECLVNVSCTNPNNVLSSNNAEFTIKLERSIVINLTQKKFTIFTISIT